LNNNNEIENFITEITNLFINRMEDQKRFIKKDKFNIKNKQLIKIITNNAFLAEEKINSKIKENN